MSEKHGMSEEEWASVERETKAFKAEWIKKKVITYTLLSLMIMSSAWNAYFSTISFIATNLSIRESFYFSISISSYRSYSKICYILVLYTYQYA